LFGASLCVFPCLRRLSTSPLCFNAKLRACALGSASPSPTPSSPSDHGVHARPSDKSLAPHARARPRQACVRAAMPKADLQPRAHAKSTWSASSTHRRLLAASSATACEYAGSSSSTPPCSRLRLRSLQAHPRLLCSAPSMSSTSQCSLRRTLQTNSVSSG
jgi:hypothetical protein